MRSSELEEDNIGNEPKEDDYNELAGEDLEGFSIKEEGDEFAEFDEEDDLLEGDDVKNEEEEEMF